MAASMKAFLLATAVLTCAAIWTQAEEGVDLRLKLKPGQVLRYDVSGQHSLEVGMAGAKSTIANTQTFSGSYRVVSVDQNGNYEMKMRVERITISAHSPAMVNWPARDIDYDSSKPEGNEKTLTGMFCSLLMASEFTARVSPTGKIIESSNMEDIGKKLTAAFPKDADQIAKMTGVSSSEGLWPVFCERPQEATKPGGSWPVERTMGDVMRLTARVKLDKVEKGCAFVVVAGLDTAFGDFAKPQTTPRPDAALAKSIKVTKSEANGTTEIDLATGAILSTGGNTVVEYSMSDPDSGQTINYRMAGNGTVKLPPAEGVKPAEKK